MSLTLDGNSGITLNDKGVNLSTNIVITSGAGSPEGVVAAPVGSIYTNISGGVSTTLYIKTSGAALPTGWTAK